MIGLLRDLQRLHLKIFKDSLKDNLNRILKLMRRYEYYRNSYGN
jgi:hypothetical protein